MDIKQFIKSLIFDDIESSSHRVCLLYMGSQPDALYPVYDNLGQGLYQIELEALIREKKPEDFIYLESGDSTDMSVVKKCLQYLARRGDEIPVCTQLSDEEVAENLQISVEEYQDLIVCPDSPCLVFGG